MRQPSTGWIESRWTRVNGLRMHARVSANPIPNDVPNVVLVHGIGITSRYWIPTLIRLGLDFHVYAPDLPGFGKSDKPERTQTLPELADSLAHALAGSTGQCSLSRAGFPAVSRL